MLCTLISPFNSGCLIYHIRAIIPRLQKCRSAFEVQAFSLPIKIHLSSVLHFHEPNSTKDPGGTEDTEDLRDPLDQRGALDLKDPLVLPKKL